MKTHLKGLLRKELYLLKNNYVRLSLEIILLIVLGIILNILTGPNYKEKRKGENMLNKYGYTSGSNGSGSFGCKEFDYGLCKDTYSEKSEIGFINKGGRNEKIFFDKLKYVLKKNNPKLSFKGFNSKDDMLDYARSENIIDGKRHTLCLGISFDKDGDEYKYKLFVASNIYTSQVFKENFYNELSLYSL